MTETIIMPKSAKITDQAGNLNPEFFNYMGGIEKLSKRTCAKLDPATATVADLIAALQNAGLMEK